MVVVEVVVVGDVVVVELVVVELVEDGLVVVDPEFIEFDVSGEARLSEIRGGQIVSSDLTFELVTWDVVGPPAKYVVSVVEVVC